MRKKKKNNFDALSIRKHTTGRLSSTKFSAGNLFKSFGIKKFGGKNDTDWDGIVNSKDCQPNNPFRQDVYYRGVDRKELNIFNKTGKLYPHGKDKRIWITPKKAIAERYGSNIMTFDLDPRQVKTAPGRSKMFYTENHIPNASLAKQAEWREMSVEEKNQQRQTLPDSDGDGVPDCYDCEPSNPERQDSRIVIDGDEEKSYIILNPDGREIQILQDKYDVFLEYAYDLGMSLGYTPDKDTIQAYYGSKPSRIFVRWT